jgi:hypothetical protein
VTDPDSSLDADRDPADARATARAYYAAVDDGDYDRLRSLLAPEFVQDREDRTLDGREAFVRFMREERPETATTHEIRATYVARRGDAAPTDADDAAAGPAPNPESDPDHDPGPDAPVEVAVRGLLRRPDGRPWFRFVDVFALDAEGRLATLLTFTRDPASDDEAAGTGTGTGTGA